MHNLSGGRGVLGVGRGTVPREAETLGTAGRHLRQPRQGRGRPHQPGDDGRGDGRRSSPRWRTRRSATTARTTTSRRPGSPTAAAQVEQLTLVPRPLYPYEIWQADHLAADARARARARASAACSGCSTTSSSRQRWERFAGDLRGRPRHGAGAGREAQLVLEHPRRGHPRAGVGDGRGRATTSSGSSSARTAGRRATWAPTASRRPPGLIPTLEESVEQKVWVIGTPEEVAEGIAELPRRAARLSRLTVFPHFPGDTYDRGRGADGPLHGGGRSAVVRSARRFV